MMSEASDRSRIVMGRGADVMKAFHVALDDYSAALNEVEGATAELRLALEQDVSRETLPPATTTKEPQ
jgi:hypothetical protein